MNTQLKDVEKVHFTEIPSIFTNDAGEFWLKHGLHVWISYSSRVHKIYISEKYKTNMKALGFTPIKYSTHDLLAFHVFRYVKEECSFTCHSWQILWKLLRYSNSFGKTVKKYINMLSKYYDSLKSK